MPIFLANKMINMEMRGFLIEVVVSKIANSNGGKYA